MWWDVVIDVLAPTREVRSVERLVEKGEAGKLAVEFRVPRAFARRLNQSGWLADEVIAAGLLRQGKAPSLIGLVTGLALIQVLRPRPSKSLPREFVLAATADRVVAFALSPLKEGDGTTETVVRIKPGERGSWPRELVRLIEPPTGGKLRGATLELGGEERIPVSWDGDDSTDELVELLAS
jgi:hypothetical protein